MARASRKKLSDKARAYVEARGTSEPAARLRGIRDSSPEDTRKKFGRASAALVIPYRTTIGELLLNKHAPFERARLLTTKKFAGKSVEPKFLQPKGTQNHIYYDPARKDWPKVLADSARPLLITEGEFKAIAATEFGLPHTIAIGGVWSWRTKINGTSVPLPEFDEIACENRPIHLVFDSDSTTNPDVLAALVALTAELTRRGAKVQQIKLPAAADGSKQGLDDYLVANGREAFEKLQPEPVRLILSASDAYEAAKLYCQTHWQQDGARSLHFWRGGFYGYAGSHYKPQELGAIRAGIYEFLAAAQKHKSDGTLVDFAPNKKAVDDVVDAIKAHTHRDKDAPARAWPDGRATPKADNILPCANGLLDFENRTLHDHAPEFFCTFAVPFDYDPKAPEPKQWLAFLRSLWPKDAQSVALLQELFGLWLTDDTRYQKMGMIVGPKRSGKGTIGRVLTALLGKENVAAPTLASLGTNFGLWPLIDKPVGIISDARLSGRTDIAVVAERLLSISGEDTLTIDRKYQEHYTGRLTTRFLILTNELPKFNDASGALASRFLILQLQNSFYGREDHGLTDKLLAELPSVLNWSLVGLARLRKRGYFVPPESTMALVREMEDLASPVAAFVRDCCVTKGTNLKVSCDRLFGAWQHWCREHGHTWTGTAASFGRDLRAVLPALDRRPQRVDGKLIKHYMGVGVKDKLYGKAKYER